MKTIRAIRVSNVMGVGSLRACVNVGTGFAPEGASTEYQASEEIIAASGRLSWMRAIRAMRRSVVMVCILQVRAAGTAAFDP